MRSTHHSWGAPGVPGRDVVSVIVPTFNERSNIAVLIYLILEELDRLGESGEVVVVDDSSPDGTAEVVRQLQSTYG